MHFFVQIFLTALLGYGAEQFLPWWSVSCCAMLIAFLFPQDGARNFLSGFTAICCLWMSMAAYIDVRTHSILSAKIAPMFGFQSSILLVLLTGLLGGMVGGLSAWSGQQLKKFFVDNEPGYY